MVETKAKVETLKEEMFRLEPKIDLLHDLLGYGRYAEVTRTSDGFFLGRARGDIGFNEFLGRPSEATLARTKALLEKMSDLNREKALAVLQRFGVTVSYTFSVIE